MRRFHLAMAASLALIVTCVVWAQEQQKRLQIPPPAETGSQRSGRANVDKQGAGPLHFNVDQFIKDYDRNGDGFLQKDEVPPYMREHFDELDTDKDGKLSREELEKGAMTMAPRRRPSDVVYLLVETSDFDKEALPELQRMYDVLHRLDKNKDGKLDPQELSALREQMQEERVSNIMKELDTNGDGKISREEARGPIRRNFDHIDTNKDGFIDRDELMRAASERSPARKER